ncbi:unnamed protein product [Mycena citricolor]|uniref:Secreted protein n=1 Tax=Mycena citricolor TaxID=2018698 RepID=A0AAD2HT55_9AGAR|nr:unnamed protein product [Mycena citricolor]
MIAPPALLCAAIDLSLVSAVQCNTKHPASIAYIRDCVWHPSRDMLHKPGPSSLCTSRLGQAATWISSPCASVANFRSGCMCSQQLSAPTRTRSSLAGRRSGSGETAVRQWPDASPNTVLSMCVGFILRRCPDNVPSGPTMI